MKENVIYRNIKIIYYLHQISGIIKKSMKLPENERSMIVDGAKQHALLS